MAAARLEAVDTLLVDSFNAVFDLERRLSSRRGGATGTEDLVRVVRLDGWNGEQSMKRGRHDTDSPTANEYIQSNSML